jgi:hypothetical protein
MALEFKISSYSKQIAGSRSREKKNQQECIPRILIFCVFISLDYKQSRPLSQEKIQSQSKGGTLDEFRLGTENRPLVFYISTHPTVYWKNGYLLLPV